ncbi:MAG TPA: aldo/keto reductase [Erysipelotrichaceae bacterium]|nr:aldo/keto reductase [Erysipelotrichaceae bacterium]
METIQLNKEVSLSRIVQGFWRLHNWDMDAQALLDFMKQCVELGVTSFDTAEIYGNYTSEKLLGDALALDPLFRTKIQIITKTGINKLNPNKPYRIKHYETTYEKIKQSCYSSLKKLNTTYIDVYLIHREDPLFDQLGAVRAFNELMEEGCIKSYGVCNYDPFKLDAFHTLSNFKCVTNQIEISPLQFEHFNSGMMDLLQKYQIHPMIWSPLNGGNIFTSNDENVVNLRNILERIATKHNTTTDTIVYAWHLKHPVKAMVISGTQKISRLQNAINALQINLEHEEWYEIYCASGQQILR